VSKGWTVEVSTENAARWGDNTVSVQSFDVAIEDQSDAEDAVRQRAGERAVVQFSRERLNLHGLSPGRMRSRPSVLVPRSRLARSA
jgi:hypothetical protein